MIRSRNSARRYHGTLGRPCSTASLSVEQIAKAAEARAHESALIAPPLVVAIPAPLVTTSAPGVGAVCRRHDFRDGDVCSRCDAAKGGNS